VTPPSVLISFCNLGAASESGLLLCDPSRSTTRWLDLGLPTSVTGCTGIARARGCVLTMVECGDEVCVAILDADELRPLSHQRITRVRSPHSLCATDDTVLIVSTGTDEVVAYRWEPGGLTFQGVVWTPSRAGTDTHHLNSIVYRDSDHIWVTAFGPKASDLWQSASDGYICNIVDGSVLKTGINQPHSVCAFGRTMYYCESGTQGVTRLDGARTCRANGYTRGLSVLDEHRAIFGTSVGRAQSKSTGIMCNPADPGTPAGGCALHEWDVQTGVVTSTDMSEFGPEIYDVIRLT